jgi:tetratricopeptide (TPR) repeat protein
MALGLLCNLYNKANKREWILSIADSADKLGIHESLIERNRAVSLHRLGRESEAEKSYMRAMEINPKDDQAVAWYADFLDDAGKFQEAYSLFENAILLDPNDGGTFINLGINLVNRGMVRREDGGFDGPVSQKDRIKAVIPLFMKALELSPRQELVQKIVRVLVRTDAVPEADAIAHGRRPDGVYNNTPLNYIEAMINTKARI